MTREEKVALIKAEIQVYDWIDHAKDVKIFAVGYRGDNGWKTRNYVGTLDQLIQAVPRLHFDKICVNVFPMTLLHCLRPGAWTDLRPEDER